MRPVATNDNERHYVAIGTYLNNLVLNATNIFVAIDWNPCSVGQRHAVEELPLLLSDDQRVFQLRAGPGAC
jgi:hypothetical protein